MAGLKGYITGARAKIAAQSAAQSEAAAKIAPAIQSATPQGSNANKGLEPVRPTSAWKDAAISFFFFRGQLVQPGRQMGGSQNR